LCYLTPREPAPLTPAGAEGGEWQDAKGFLEGNTATPTETTLA